MKLSIQYKLFAAMLCAALAVVGYMAIVIQWSFDRGFLEYVNLEEQKEINRLGRLLEAYYDEYRNWAPLVERPLLILKMHAMTLPEGGRKRRLLEMAEKGNLPEWLINPQGEERKKPRHPIQRTLLLDSEGSILFGQKLGTKLPHMIPILHEGQQVGSLGLYSPEAISETHQLLFVEKQKIVILTVGIAAVFISIGISLPLAYHLTKPLRRLSRAANLLISGDFSTRVKEHTNDELGVLSRDINVLAKTLEENEIQRKLWVSDIAHELRTPLTSLQGEIEALQDGIRKPDSRTYENLHCGVMRLARLVDDLYDLARSDLGTLSIYPEELDFSMLVENEVATLGSDAERAGLKLEIISVPKKLPVYGDKQRLQQLVSNLLTNSIRYTNEGGAVMLSMDLTPAGVLLDVQDTAPGVPDEALPRLFTRLYRVEQSRNRALGGSGLGLAISSQIVKAHNGTISAQHASIGGLRIQVILPAALEDV